MTEDEAKTKACFRAATFAGSQQIADGPGPNCIGSACMAWRWVAKSGTDDGGKPNYYPGHWKGYCGLAGKP